MQIPFQHKKVLVAPLDWGLGHATRCIPIIHELLQQQNEVWIAAEGNIEKLLKTEFPNLQFVSLFNYNIQYSTSGNWLWLSMLAQFSKIKKCIANENKWLNNFIENKNFDVIISDNRYGLYNSKAYCVFITHQLRLNFPQPFSCFEFLSENYFKKFISKYDECWIPDYEKMNESLSGKLSHSGSTLKNIKFIEPLSRFKNFIPTKKSIESDILILISGPEPQRTIWEKIIFQQISSLSDSSKKIIVVGGNFSNNNDSSLKNNIEYHSSIAASELYYYLSGAKKIICRSGYSTVMDLNALQKKAVFVPTPGQTEQEYLARWLHKKDAGIFIPQNQFRLKNF